MSDENVGQLQRLHPITQEQIAAHAARTIGVLGGNGRDLINPNMADAGTSDSTRFCPLMFGHIQQTSMLPSDVRCCLD